MARFELDAAIRDLTEAVSGVDWDAERVQENVQTILGEVEDASTDELDAALACLVDRIRAHEVADGDGTAHVAITAGTLVENGADAAPLARVLLEKIPEVLRAARRYADLCLADPRTPAAGEDDESLDEDEDSIDDDEVLADDLDEGEEDWSEEEAEDWTEEDWSEDDEDSDELEEGGEGEITHVDQRPILREVFRDHLAEDRGGAAALAYLGSWTLPAIAAWTRDRDCLWRASQNEELVGLAERMFDSEAHWLRHLLGAQLDARWLVLCPLESRGFEVAVDGVVSNFDLHALLAAALIPLGIPGESNPPEITDYLSGRGPAPQQNHVVGSWNLYDHRAAGHDLRDGSRVPQKYWVWGEGIPNDVPTSDGRRILVVGPAAYVRTWGVGRTFSDLDARVEVLGELDADSYRRTLESLT